MNKTPIQLAIRKDEYKGNELIDLFNNNLIDLEQKDTFLNIES